MTIAIRVQVVGWGDILILANFETMSRYISRYTEEYGMIYWNRLPSSYVLQCVSFDHAHTLHSAQCTQSQSPSLVGHAILRCISVSGFVSLLTKSVFG